MGVNARIKAARKAERLQQLSPTKAKYVSVAHLSNEERRVLQKQRDTAKRDVRREYETALMQINTAYSQQVMAALTRFHS